MWVLLSRMGVQCKKHGQPPETEAAVRNVGGKPGGMYKHRKPRVKFQRVYETRLDAIKSFNTRLEKYPFAEDCY